MVELAYPDPAWLRQKYLDEGLSTYDIGRLVGRNPKTIYLRLVAAGIPTRPRGANLAGADNFMRHPGAVDPFSGHSHSAATRAVLSAKARGPKPHLRGPRNGMHGRTGATNPNFKDGSSPERQRLYAAGSGRAALRAVYERDGFRCVRCGAPKAGPRSLHAHHLKPWAGCPELRFAADNLITLCRACHGWVHSRANVAGEYLA